MCKNKKVNKHFIKASFKHLLDNDNENDNCCCDKENEPCKVNIDEK